ncbi:MAG: hypothetical protein QME78_15760, partial [Thermodesulfobacteriota bacterium]|nr:hypothetical protein [Thermodesulfobacteriota bacterium]
MSETVSYRMRAMNGRAGETLIQNLERRGIFFHDPQAWATAEERVKQLHGMLERELKKHRLENPDRDKNSSIGREWGRADAMLRSFCSVPAFVAYAESNKADDLQEINKEVNNIQNNGQGWRENEAMKSLRWIQERIEGLATETQRELCQMEKEVLLEASSEALKSLGYRIERHGDAMKASLDRTCIWVETNPWGGLSLDCSGFSGLSCLEEVKRAENALALKGIVLTRNSSEFHGKPEGGCLA